MRKVDILSKLPKTDFQQRVAAAKWSEILEGLNIAVDLIGPVPKLTAGDYGELVQKLKRLGDHSHVQVTVPAVGGERSNPPSDSESTKLLCHRAQNRDDDRKSVLRLPMLGGFYVPSVACPLGRGAWVGFPTVLQERSGGHAA